MKKMSYVSAIDAVLSGAPVEGEVAERLTALRGSLAKRSASKSGKPTKTQIANEGLKERILEVLTSEGVTAKAVGEALEVSSQKASALLKQLVDTGKVAKETVKGKSLFRLAE